MARQRIIVGVGEALLCEYPDRIQPGGLAALTALHAVRLGHTGVLVSRLGQDQAADQLLKQLRDHNVNIDALQSDPDLATGRLIVRSIAGKTVRTLTPRAAFDNLQWDFDLVDVAQRADAVVFGELARRDGQSRSIIKRFLAECASALKICDLTNRPGEAIHRAEARSGMELADGLIADSAALAALVPGWNGKDFHQAASEIIRSSNLSFVATIERGDCTETLNAHSAQQMHAAAQSHPSANHEAAIVGLALGILAGADLPKSLETAIEAAAVVS